MFTPKKEKKKKDIPQKKMQKTQPHTSSEKNHRGRLEKKLLGAMIRSLEKVKGKMRS